MTGPLFPLRGAAAGLIEAAGTSVPCRVCGQARRRSEVDQLNDSIPVRYRGLAVFIMPAALLGCAAPATLPLLALVLAFVAGVLQPLRAAAIQRLAGDTIRARAASAASACDAAVATLLLPIAGLWRSRRRL